MTLVLKNLHILHSTQTFFFLHFVSELFKLFLIPTTTKQAPFTDHGTSVFSHYIKKMFHCGAGLLHHSKTNLLTSNYESNIQLYVEFHMWSPFSNIFVESPVSHWIYNVYWPEQQSYNSFSSGIHWRQIKLFQWICLRNMKYLNGWNNKSATLSMSHK